MSMQLTFSPVVRAENFPKMTHPACCSNISADKVLPESRGAVVDERIVHFLQQ